MKIKSIIFPFLFLIYSQVFGQLNTDSIRYYLHHKDLNTRIESVTRLAWELSPPTPDTSLYYALLVNKDIGKEVTKTVESFNYHIIGSIYLNISDYQSARPWLEKAYDIRVKQKDETELLITLINTIYTWQGLGDMKKIHRYVFESEQLCDKISETNSRYYIIALNQLGDIYSTLKRFDKANEAFLKAIEKSEKRKDPQELALSYQNYSSFLIGRQDYKKALKFIEKGLEFQKMLNKPDEYRTSRVNLAIAYAETGRKDEALKIFKDVYELELKGYDFYEKSSAANNLGFFYFTENEFRKALEYFMESLKYANEAKAFKLMMDRYQMISETHEQLRDYKSALKFTRLYQNLNDSMFSVETVKQLNDLTEKYGIEKKEKKILELKKNNAEIKLKEEETKRESQRNNIIFGSLIVLVLVIAVFIYYSLIQKKKANLSLTAKNEQIERQHQMLEEKQKEILDSIHYAKRIQQSLMPTEKFVAKKISGLQKK